MRNTFILATLLAAATTGCKKEQAVKTNADAVAQNTLVKLKTETTTVSVPLGGDIQAAIDQVAAAGGGTVNLASGTYHTTATLKIKSNVTLNGQGNPTTTITGGNFNIIEEAAEGQSNMTIQNLKITGVKSTSCYGILIEALTTGHTNVTITNVQVTSVGMGVHLKRVDGITISNCNFHDNAGPGMEKYFHNLYIRASQNVNVSATNVSNSTTGNGINVSYCTNVTITGCTASNNYFRGIRAADTDGFTAKDCTINGNGDIGLLMNQEAGMVTKNINLDHNTVTNNQAGGIQVLSGSTGQVINNTATGNTNFNYSIASGVTQSNNN